MSLREDNGPYCLVWLGVLLMGAYYTNFAYLIWTNAAASAAFFANIGFMLGLMILPPLMIFFFTGYLRPTRGKAKMTMLGPSVFLGLLYVILIYTILGITNMDIILGEPIVFSAWGIGSAILTAGGFAIVQSYEQSTSPGMLDVSKLYYGPPKEEEPEPEPEIETPAEPVVEAAEATETTEVVETPEEPEADSGESKPDEPVSE